MPRKFYYCREFPQLTIAGVCQFTNHEYDTTSLVIQSKIEQSQSFTSGAVGPADGPEPTIEDEALALLDLKPSDLKSLKKAELVDVAKMMEVDFGEEATRLDLIGIIAAELKRR